MKNFFLAEQSTGDLLQVLVYLIAGLVWILATVFKKRQQMPEDLEEIILEEDEEGGKAAPSATNQRGPTAEPSTASPPPRPATLEEALREVFSRPPGEWDQPRPPAPRPQAPPPIPIKKPVAPVPEPLPQTSPPMQVEGGAKPALARLPAVTAVPPVARRPKLVLNTSQIPLAIVWSEILSRPTWPRHPGRR